MYTRCPTCSTCFRVTDRHLAIAKGKVRCGQCQLVFNAPEHAIDDLPVNQLTPAATKKPAAVVTPTQKPIIEKSPTPTPAKEVIPPPIAPTAKEKLELNAQVEQIEEKIIIKPVAKPAVSFDAESTMIADVSNLSKEEVEDINLDTSFSSQDSLDEDDDDIFDDSFDLNAAIDELTQPSNEEAENIATTEIEIPSTTEDNSSSTADKDIFHTDAYDATSASSITDILDEMEGQMSLDITVPKNKNAVIEEYDANKEFDFLTLDGEPNAKIESEDDKVDEFEVLKPDNDADEEFDNLENKLNLEESFEIELANKDTENKSSIDEDELFNHIDLSDFKDDDLDESIVLEEPEFENSKLQNIGQHAVENDVPIQLRKDIEHLQISQHNWHPLIAPVLIVILLLLSFSQLAYFRSHELVQQIPSSRPLLEAFCETIGCKYSGPRDTKQIQLLSRDVRLHPKQKNALLISAAMINNAYFSQPYPKIHIRLSDISGNVVAERIFDSKTYMGKLSSPFLLMKSKTPVHINFEVVDPGKDAINFEFTFL